MRGWYKIGLWLTLVLTGCSYPDTFGDDFDPSRLSIGMTAEPSFRRIVFRVSVTRIDPERIERCGVCWGPEDNGSLTPDPARGNYAGPEGEAGLHFTVDCTAPEAEVHYARPYLEVRGLLLFGPVLSVGYLDPTDFLPAVRLDLNPVAVSSVSLTLQGNTVSSRKYPVTERGFCYSAVSALPTVADPKVTAPAGSGDYRASLTGLRPGTLYYVRAYAVNEAGTAYSDTEAFTTRPEGE